MITLKMDFNGDDFERNIVEQFRRNFQAQLDAAGLSSVTFTMTKDSSGDLKAELSGPEEDIARAKELSK